MRSKGSLKPSLPCLDDPVTKLEGLGEKTRRNLLDVRACAATLDLAATIPQDCPNCVTTGKPAVLSHLHQLQSLHSRWLFQSATCADSMRMDHFSVAVGKFVTTCVGSAAFCLS